MRRRIRALVEGEAGAVVIEFALCIPIMMMVVFGVIDFSRAYYTLNDLTSAVREGARVAAVQPDPLSSDAVTKTKTAVKHFAIAFGGLPVRDDQITVSFSNPNDVTVVIQNYQFEFITPLAALMGRGDNKLIFTPRTAVFRWERQPLPTAGGT